MEQKITAWIARDENGILCMYPSKPKKSKAIGAWYDRETCGIVVKENDNFPQVKWEDDEPTKVELAIKICE